MFLVSTGQLLLSGLLLGLGLTMDAAAVSMSNGLEEPNMKPMKIFYIALLYGLFQGIMPLLGYFFGHVLFENFTFIQEYHLIPIVALIILLILGTKMIIDGIKEIKKPAEEREIKKIGFKLLIIQAIATSIDALSTGLSFADYQIYEAIIVVSLITLVTFIACIISVLIGKKFGDKLGSKAVIIGGIILIAIGIEIFVTGIWF